MFKFIIHQCFETASCGQLRPEGVKNSISDLLFSWSFNVKNWEFAVRQSSRFRRSSSWVQFSRHIPPMAIWWYLSWIPHMMIYIIIIYFPYDDIYRAYIYISHIMIQGQQTDFSHLMSEGLQAYSYGSLSWGRVYFFMILLTSFCKSHSLWPFPSFSAKTFSAFEKYI